MRILIGVDGSEAALEAVRQAGQLASPTRDSIALYYAPVAAQSTETGGPQGNAHLVFAQARTGLPAGWSGDVLEMAGTVDPREGLLSAADTWGADLIAVGARGLGAFKRWLLGSVSTAIVHSASVPVMVARQREGRAPAAPLRVLLACDPEHPSPHAEAMMHDFTWPPATVGRVIAVIEPDAAAELPAWLAPMVRSPESEKMTEAWVREYAEQKERTKSQMAALCQQLPKPFQAEPPLVIGGYPADQILEAVRSQQIDLVALGTRRLGAIGRWLGGSTSDKVLFYADCSVLVVPEPRRAHPTATGRGTPVEPA